MMDQETQKVGTFFHHDKMEKLIKYNMHIQHRKSVSLKKTFPSNIKQFTV